MTPTDYAYLALIAILIGGTSGMDHVAHIRKMVLRPSYNASIKPASQKNGF
jgi:hypothetical protein